MINYYELEEVKALAPKYHNPNFDKHNISIPFRMGIIGSSGSGKTNIVINLIRIMSGTFNKIYLFTKNNDETLYNYMKTKLKSDQMEQHNGVEELNNVDLDTAFNDQQVLIIFDDLVLEKDQSAIQQLFIRGRKLGKGVSLCYLAQTYYGIPKNIRMQFTYIILRKLPNKRDINAILKESSCGLDSSELLELYNFCTRGDITSFLLMELSKPPEEMFRKNFDKFIRLS